MLLDASAAHVAALEPSAAMEAPRRNNADRGDRVTCVQKLDEQLPLGDFGAVLSIGVLHHIAEPAPVVRRAYEALKPGGRFIVWICRREGNRLYLALAHMLVVPLSLYALLCRFLSLPMRNYMRSVIGRYGWRHRFLTIFDQLNPAYARYYTQDKARQLLKARVR